MSLAIMGYKKGMLIERSPEDGKLEMYKYILKNMKKNPAFLKKIIKDTARNEKIVFYLYKRFSKERKKLNNKELWETYKRWLEKYVSFLSYPLIVECTDIFTTYHLEDAVRKELPDLTPDEMSDLIIAMSSPKELSFMEHERLDFLKACIKNYGKLKKKHFEKQSKKHWFVINSFRNIRYLSPEYFLKEAKKETKKNKKKLEAELKSLKNKIPNLKKRKKEILKKYKLSNNLKLHFKIIEEMGEGIDKRKEKMLQCNYFIDMYCEEIANRFDLKKKEVHEFTVEEIEELLLKNKKPSKTSVKKRYEMSAYVMKRKGNTDDVETKWFYGKKAEKLIELTGPDLTGEIKGYVASAPVDKIRGTAQIIMNTHEEKFKKGNILVTTMTRPDFVPLMRKAKAIITDEGGITCHAAVISRELKIPCIIGTKKAKKLLKDNDIIEMDLKKGVVRRLSK
ncbi:MAG: hypothetical protein ISS25_02605 [Nanoarchaeota archaeon]|nr:hypothetical protein [DPANN group archaeon]MBL7116694.1 hypothetical protein [Nanoarchaeota archaeon]